VALHRHHDVEALRAHLPDRLLKGQLDRLNDIARETQLVDQFASSPIGDKVGDRCDDSHAVILNTTDAAGRAHAKYRAKLIAVGAAVVPDPVALTGAPGPSSQQQPATVCRTSATPSCKSAGV